ncbi:cupin domain-containing protein [Histoplasma capsulatum G186AR]|uniref:Cupin domain-containing protein n=1 Tax=Ajellomyces capsulatus (strain G186AR / H82 / ATCC MYA-2454 / RMSCC 2432) TaxID=447093 RepID=C0NRC0_AJECG|nr:cupin domain-containing protein [Histoplasma capsulatum G186AR]EEH06234.1 cupin domain-containing protein [Histoplasma capsulatum G186AR]
MAATLTALHSLRVGRQQIPPCGFHRSTTASEISQHLTKTCVAEPQWTCSIHIPSPPVSLHHARDNPERFDAVVSSRDFLVVPAGVARGLLHDNEAGVKTVGAYPMGKLWNMCYGDEEE